ncbi:dihydrodipicolinate synthase [Novosphingobium sp. 17-62-19]|uniref:dihydrodipicolinate synthase family protein n=1 Tax=Novosphingobium sp. 17-62-19 TaxID=1970406 RepID=UPI0025E96373|nr:dihydrodipicolinate synthase [Novosphingobium sp. 17-62-19]HQS96526.1 dihydrodipicolinate synthase [Novosphingobium sp.]
MESVLANGRIVPDSSTPQRQWAQAKLTGLMNLIQPTFRRDGGRLDEEAIRIDVRAAIAQGFSGTMPMPNWTMPGSADWDSFHRIVCDEARGKIAVHGIVAGRDPEADRAVLGALERHGVDLVLLAPTFPRDVDARRLYDLIAARAQATALPAMLYAATGRRAFPALGPEGQPLDVYDRLADLPNVVAVKVSQTVSATATELVCERLGDRLSMGPVNLAFLPQLARRFRIAWSGQWNAEAIQTPQDRAGVQLLDASACGDLVRLDALAERLRPVLAHFFAVQAPVLAQGAHPWPHNRYYQWLGGGSGGLLPADPHVPSGVIPVLDAAGRAAIRAAFAAAGLEPVDAEDDDVFIVGRAAWGRGERPGAATKTSGYSRN